MITGKTSTGFEFKVGENITQRWDFATAIAKTQAKDEAQQVAGAVELVRIVLGDQEEALCNHLKETKGAALTEDIMKEIGEILEKSRETKKS